VAEKSGDVRECALAGARRGRGADMTGQVHSVEREKGTHGATAQQLANGARVAEREEGRAGEETGADRSAPLGSERERESARERGRPLTGRVRLSGGAGAWARGLAGPSWAGWDAFPFSFSLDFLILFLFLFYRVFNSKFKLGFYRRFEPGGSLGRRVNCRRVSQPRWVGARRSAKGGRSRREAGVKGETRSLRVCPAPRSGALAVGGYKRPRGREREAYASAVPSFPAWPTLCKRALDLPFIGVRRGSRCTMGGVAVC
jgi:hypothetical protein